MGLALGVFTLFFVIFFNAVWGWWPPIGCSVPDKVFLGSLY